MRRRVSSDETGFSLIELMLAMGITLTVMVIASSLIAQSFNLRSRENRRSEALADTQRAIQSMTRDIANAGMGLSVNGLVTGDSTATSIRIRTNLNAATESPGDTADDGEDVKYMLVNDANGIFIVRQNLQPAPASWAAATSILANRVDSMTIRYFREKVSYTADPTNCNITSISPTNVTVGSTTVANEVAASPTSAGYVVISVCVQLPAVGTSGQGGYQPASRVQLVSDATLRNSKTMFY
ncbi:MAG TPA: prepilin-type N-terminal cleavage/methylation domain-containing protein [Pyrinomonadaceae bacterium]|jgi:type II secretory pathway pseudopilin PulG